MVRLLLRTNWELPPLLPSFNPTMVRLLLRRLNFRKAAPTLFQSHNGAIAAFPLAGCPERRSGVSIPQWCDCCNLKRFDPVEGFVGFNPTMVRLLR